MKHIFTAGAALCTFLWACAATAQHTDPHAIYERRCAGCHTPHAGEFVSEELIQTGEGLAGKSSGRLVLDMLTAGHGKLSKTEVDILIEHLVQISTSGQLFRRKCIICHDNAARFARLDLIIRDGVLMGRYTDRDVADFLENHGRLDGAEVEKMVEVLKRQLLVR